MKYKHVIYPLIFVSFFVGGLAMGFTYTPAQGANLAPASDASAFAMQPEVKKTEEQLNVLVIGVDEVGKTETRLRSIWLILVPPGGGELVFMPIYPQPASTTNALYASAHEPLIVDSRSPASATIIRVLAEQGTWWNEVVVADEIGILEMLNLLGGVEGYRPELAGLLSTEGAPMAWENPQMALANQASLFKGICGRSSSFASLLSPGTF
ncbi:MAG: hypothetical protein N2C13_06465, partial [Chloroflexota bacterium]